VLAAQSSNGLEDGLERPCAREARGLRLRHDHGSNYMSGDFQDEIECLGIEASPSFVREPEGNGVAERFIRTLKENLLWVKTFDTIEELRAALVELATRYNETWLVARHGYKTPAKIREEQTMPQIAIDPTFAATLPLAA
jgi:putative transposase